MQAELERDGFALAPSIASSDELTALIETLETAEVARAERGGQTFGARNLLDLAKVRAMARSNTLAAFLTPLLGPRWCAVRGLFFDKTKAANWPVLWHQDISLAVAERNEIPGWINWSVKRGVSHVQPPADILARMVTVRLHLDDCDRDNGPLRVISGSHRDGILSRDAVRERISTEQSQTVVAKAGDALFMRPLILHASSPAARPRHRRVLHLEFAPLGLLPETLSWATSVPGPDDGQ